MVDTVATSASLRRGNKGISRTVFRNPRSTSNQRYYVVYEDTSDFDVKIEWSSDGTTWTNTPTVLLAGTEAGDCFEVKIHDDTANSRLRIFFVQVDVTNDLVAYRRFSVGDSEDAPVADGSGQSVTAMTDGITADPHSCSISRTSNGRLVVVYTTDSGTMGQIFRETHFIGSDDDSAAPTWSGDTLWDDPSVDMDNVGKGEVWAATYPFSSGIKSGNGFMVCARVPDGSNSTSYRGSNAVPEWNGTSFSVTTGTDFTVSFVAPAAKVVSCVVDSSDFSHVLFYDNDTDRLRSRKSSSAGGLTWDAAIQVKANDVDACSLTIDLSASPDDLYAFYHDAADTVDFHYKTRLANLGRADGTLANTGFTAVGAVTVHEAIDDLSPDDDTTYIETPTDSDGDCRVSVFDPPSDPQGTSQTVTVRVRETTVGVDYQVIVDLFEAGTFVKEVINDTLLTVTYQDFTGTISDADYTDANDVEFRIRMVHSSGTGGTGRVTSLVWKTGWGPEQTITIAQDVTALSTAERDQVSGEIHVAGQYGTTVFYHTVNPAPLLGAPEFMTAIRPGIQRSPFISILSEEEEDLRISASLLSQFIYPRKEYKPLSISGNITTIGDIIKQTDKQLAGTLETVGDITKKTNKVLDGILSFVGDLTIDLQLFVVKIMSAIRPGINRAAQIVSMAQWEERKREEYVSIYTRMKRLVRLLAQTFPLSISGTLTTTGDIVKKTEKVLSGSLTLIGDIVKQTNKVIDGSITFIGDFASKLDAIVFRMAAIRPAIERSKTIVMMARGDKRLEESYVSWFTRMHRLVRNVFFPITLAGTLSFTGDIVKQTNKVLSGNLTSIGDITKQINKLLTGSVDFVGAISKKTLKILDGIMSLVGDIQTKFIEFTTKIMAAIRPGIERSARIASGSGEQERQRDERGWWFANFLRRLTRKPTQTFILIVAGTLTFVGDITKKTLKQLAGNLTFVGDITKKTSKILSGILSFTGDLDAVLDAVFMRMTAIRPGIQRAVTIVSMAQEDMRKRTSFVSWYSTMRRLVRTPSQTFFLVVAGILSLTGDITKQTNKVLSGILSSTGDITKQTNKIIAGTLSFVGDIQTRFLDFIAKIMAAVRPGIERGAIISLIGKEKERRDIGYGWWFANSLRRLVRKPTELFLLVVSGILSFVGDIQKQTNKQLSGILSSTGDISKKTLKVLSGILSFTGDITKKVKKILSGILSFTGDIQTKFIEFATRIMAAIRPGIERSVMIAGLGRQTEREQAAFVSWLARVQRLFRLPFQVIQLVVTGILSTTGTITKVTKKSLAGSLSSVGTIVKKTLKILAGSLTYVGDIVIKPIFALIVSGTLTFTGAITKTTKKVLSGSLTLTGAISKFTKKILSGVLAFVGDIAAFITGLPTVAGKVLLKTRASFLILRTKASKLIFKK